MDFDCLVNTYRSGEYQAALTVDNARRTWSLSRRLNPTDTAALQAFYLARGGAAESFWYYDPFESAPGTAIGSNWDSTGTVTDGRYCVRFEGGFSRSQRRPGRPESTFVLKEIYGAVSGGLPPGAVPFSAVLYVTSAYVPDSPSPAYAVASLWDITVYGPTTAVPYLVLGSLFSTSAAYATVTNSWSLIPVAPYLSAGQAPFGAATVGSLLSSLNLNFYVWNSARTLDARVSELRVYEAYVDITAAGVTVRYYARSSAIVPPGPTSGGSLSSAGNAVDGNPATYASVDFADAVTGLTGSFEPGFLRVLDRKSVV